jgi:hypothetical protein
MDDRCHEAWPEKGGFLDLGAGGPKDKWAKKGSESAQVAPGFVGLPPQATFVTNSTGSTTEGSSFSGLVTRLEMAKRASVRPGAAA